MSAGEADAARGRLKGSHYLPLWAEVRGRLERTGLTITNRPVRVDVKGESRLAIAGLLGLSPAGHEPLSVRLDRLDETLRTGAAAIGLVEMIESVDGPLVDRRAVRAERVEVLTSSWASLEQHLAVDLHPGLVSWLNSLRARGSALRLAGSVDELGPLVGRGLDVLARLPVESVPLAVLAAEVAGDAHALDRSTPLGSLVASALSHLAPTGDIGPEFEADNPEGNDSEDGAEALGATAAWRESWSRVGVVCDELSASVLVLNLDVVTPARGPVSSAIVEHREAGLPLRLTLQQLRSEAITFGATSVRSCENPSVLAHAASKLGAEAMPLVCTDGQPNGAVDFLIGRLRSSGVPVAHHGDFDWGGILITNSLIARHTVEPWRFSAADYLDSVALGRVPLGDPRFAVSASWDSELVPAMQAQGVGVYEEQVIATLVADLHWHSR